MDFTLFLWLLKLGTLANLYFLVKTTAALADGLDPWLGVPAQIFFAVSAYRCLFPVRYETRAVFHRSAFSSIFATRLLATASEIVYIYAFSRVLRLLNVGNVWWIDTASWAMVTFATTSQLCVWTAVVTERFGYYFWEELGWLLIFIANTVASAWLLATTSVHGAHAALLWLSLVFAAGYLPWQWVHLRILKSNAAKDTTTAPPLPLVHRIRTGLQRSIREKNPTTNGETWGGIVGLVWMAGYWATLIPMWLYYIVTVFAPPR